MNLYRNFLIVFFFVVFLSVSIENIYAAKQFVQKSSGPVTTTRRVTTGGIPSVVKFRPDRRAILMSFSTFSGIESVNYSLTYTNNGKPEGAGGTVRESNSPTSQRELLFGTCSSGVCTYHNNVRDAKLTLVATYLNGTKKTKVYQIKK